MANTVNGTPLTRHGSRVSTRPARSAPAPAGISPAHVRATRPGPQPAVTPAPTIRTMIVCLPDDLPAHTLTGQQLHKHFGVSGTLTARFWASPALRLWQRHQMIGLRKGRPVPCVGGPIELLDLAGLRHAATVGAGIRHQVWQHAVHGTRPAIPWPTFEARHLADPDRYTWEAAAADFHRQPRVNAMRLHNTTADPAGHLAIGELEMFQAGHMAYQHYRACLAVAGDALLTAAGRTLAATSDALTHRITYLEQALRHLDTVAPHQRLAAVAL
jgi:hypothetical protein